MDTDEYNLYFSFRGDEHYEDRVQLHDTAEEAKKRAGEGLQYYFPNCFWGKVCEWPVHVGDRSPTELDKRMHPYMDDKYEIPVYKLLPPIAEHSRIISL